MRLSPCKTALFAPARESLLIFPAGPFDYGQKGVFSGDLAARSHDCAWIAECNQFCHPVQSYAAIQCNGMLPLSAINKGV
jgi:hypothetical protein